MLRVIQQFQFISPKLPKNHTFVERQERTGFKAFDLVLQAFTPETHGQ